MLHPIPADSAPSPPRPPIELEAGYRLSLILDPNGTIRHVVEATGARAAAAARLVGRMIDDLSAQNEDGAARAETWRTRLAEVRLLHTAVHYADLPPGAPEGSPAVVAASLTPVRDADGELRSLLLQVEDRTPLVAAQQELAASENRARAQEEQLLAALAIAGLGRFTLGLQEVELSGDERFWEIMGLTVDPFVSSPGSVERYFEMLHPADADRVRDAFNAAVAGGPHYDVEYRFDRPTSDGVEERWVAVMGRVESGSGGPIRMVGVIEDITDRRRGEERRLVTQKREAIGTLAGGIAHDFNNVISAILSNATVARREVESGASPLTSITEIARGAVRGADLVRQVLAYSREDEPTRGDVDLADITREACALLRPTLPAGVELRLSSNPLPAVVRGDASQLHQLVVNLVTNAGQAITGSGVIDVSYGLRVADGSDAGDHGGRFAAIVVRDDGTGMTEAVRRRVFDPFFTTKAAGEATGLGLAAALTIVRAHGGTVTVDSEVGRGTSFTCLLPAREGTAAEYGDAPRTDGPVERTPRVLFVDDERALARLAERALPMSGCEATVFVDPREALDAFTAAPHAFDALVTDLSMPGLSGLELIDAIRQIRSDLPVVLTSGFLSSSERRDAAYRGVDAILPKPCSIGDLADTVLGLVGGTT